MSSVVWTILQEEYRIVRHIYNGKAAPTNRGLFPLLQWHGTVLDTTTLHLSSLVSLTL